LKSIGVEANPVLVHSSVGKGLNHCKPSASLFNHVIVRVVIAGKEFYFDPTMQKQAGDFEHSALLNIGFGLNLTAAGEDLVALPFDLTRKAFAIKHCLNLRDGDKATVTVRRTHFAHIADRERYYIGSTEIREVQDDYFERAEADINVELKQIRPFAVVKDNLQTNTLITEEVYELTDLEDFDGKGKIEVTTNFHRSFPYPDDEKFELQMTARGRLEHDIEVLFPYDIDRESSSLSFANAYFEYDAKIRSEGQSLKYNTRVTPFREVVDHHGIEQYYNHAMRLYRRRDNRFKFRKDNRAQA
jgi:hypothetical protein